MTGTFHLRMPQLGETVEEGTVVTWLKGPGDPVRVDEPLLEVATDKVDTEIPSTVEGVVDRLVAHEGETVAVGGVLAEILVEAGDAAAETPPGGTPASGVGLDVRKEAPETPAEGAVVPPEADLRLSPVVSRLVDQHGLDLAELSRFSGGDRITKKVVAAYLDQPGIAASGSETVPFSRLRQRTAEHMVRSKTVSPHVLSVIEVDFENVERLRLARRDAFHREYGVNLTLLPFVASALVTALQDYPRLNASVGDNALVLHHAINLAIAVNLDAEGLVAPVIKNTASLPFPYLAQGAAQLAATAREGKLAADDVSGGTFTISNQGPYGTLITAPIINQPQVAIVSMDGVRKRPVVFEYPDRDEIAVRHTGCLAMSWDHRAVDGAYAAAFLQGVKREIETRQWSAHFDAPGLSPRS